jgi:hypothetical protein
MEEGRTGRPYLAMAETLVPTRFSLHRECNNGAKRHESARIGQHLRCVNTAQANGIAVQPSKARLLDVMNKELGVTQ